MVGRSAGYTKRCDLQDSRRKIKQGETSSKQGDLLQELLTQNDRNIADLTVYRHSLLLMQLMSLNTETIIHFEARLDQVKFVNRDSH